MLTTRPTRRSLSKNLEMKIYKTIILPVVLYGCETWSLALREECRIRVFENRIVRRIFGLKRDENGEWRMLHNEELHSLYSTLNIVRAIKSREKNHAKKTVILSNTFIDKNALVLQ